MGFTATSADGPKKGKGKKKTVTCYKCNKTGQHSNECEKDKMEKGSNKKDSFLVLRQDQGEVSSKEDSNDDADSG